MNDENRTFLQPLIDGEAGVKYLAGTWQQSDWLLTDDKESSEVKNYLRQNCTAAALVAAKRLEQTTWFGLLEEKEKSMKLLQMTLGLGALPTLPQNNRVGAKKRQPSDETKKKIAAYLPMDIWLYSYAKRLFDARFHYFNGGIYFHPELPPLPHFSNGGPVKPVADGCKGSDACEGFEGESGTGSCNGDLSCFRARG